MAPGSVPMPYHQIIPGSIPMHMSHPASNGMQLRPDLGAPPAAHGHHIYATAPIPFPPAHPQAYLHPGQHPHQMHHHLHPPPPPPHHHQHAQQQQQYAQQNPPERRSSFSPGETTSSHIHAPPSAPVGQPLPPPGARLLQVNNQGYPGQRPPPQEQQNIRPRSMYEDDRTVSPSVENAAHWLKKQKTVDTRAPAAGESNGALPNTPVYLSEGMLAGYSIHDPTRTPSQDTAATARTTPTTAGTMASSAHRPSLSPASAMPPSPALAYDPHNVVRGNQSMYSQHHHHHSHDFGTPPTPTPADPFAFHHEHPIVSSNPSAELKGSTFDGTTVPLDQQQLEAAAAAAAAAFATVDGQDNDDFATESPNPYHDESLPAL